MRTREEEIIDDILDEFDFGKVHQVMEFLDWTWANGEVPTLGELRKEARKLMRHCIDKEEYGISTGGFFVDKHVYEGKPYYRLIFSVTEWDNYD